MGTLHYGPHPAVARRRPLLLPARAVRAPAARQCRPKSAAESRGLQPAPTPRHSHPLRHAVTLKPAPRAPIALADALLALLCAAAARAQVPAHCKNGTLSYDISFIGPLKKIKVGG